MNRLPRIHESIASLDESLRLEIGTNKQAIIDLKGEFKLMQKDAVYTSAFDKLTQKQYKLQQEQERMNSTWDEKKLKQLDQVIDDMNQLKYEMKHYND